MNLCKTCRFYAPGVDKEGKPLPEGQCRHGAPTVFMLPIPRAEQAVLNPTQRAVSFDLRFPSAWPSVAEDRWCGQHKPAKPKSAGVYDLPINPFNGALFSDDD